MRQATTTASTSDIASRKLVGTLVSREDPERFSVHPDGKRLFVANEDDNTVTVVDIAANKVLAEVPVGIEPEGMAISPDGRTVACTSETTSMVHLIDATSYDVLANLLVDTRPRMAVFTPDGKRLLVSSELRGTLTVIEIAARRVTGKLDFLGSWRCRANSSRLSGFALTQDGSRAFVALGPANRVAEVDLATLSLTRMYLVGQRVWGLALSPDGKRLYAANGNSGDVSVIDLDAKEVLASVPVGRAPWGLCVGPMTAALSVAGVSHAFGARQALDEVSFEVQPGAFTVLLGPNGAGKTTLVSLISGLYHAQSGAISRGRARCHEGAGALALSALGIVFQMPNLDPDLTVDENLRYHAGLHGLSKPDAESRIIAQLERLSLYERRHDRVRALSGGLKRRAEIARALLHGPRLLVCDEATVGLDVEFRRGVLAHVRGLCTTDGLTVLWTTHLLDEIGDDDPVLVLHKGQVRWQGRAGELGPASADRPWPKAFSR